MAATASSSCQACILSSYFLLPELNALPDDRKLLG
jgi:hypothetical protein